MFEGDREGEDGFTDFKLFFIHFSLIYQGFFTIY